MVLYYCAVKETASDGRKIMTVSPGMFARLLGDSMERTTADEGVKALVSQYYADYTDATEYEFYDALVKVTDGGGYLNTDLDELINQVEAELRASGRPDVRTPGLSLDDENEEL